MLKLGIDPEKPPLYASTAYVVAIWPSFLFNSYVKIWDTCENFFGQMVYRLAKNFPYAYGVVWKVIRYTVEGTAMKWLEGVVCTLEDISIENEYEF